MKNLVIIFILLCQFSFQGFGQKEFVAALKENNVPKLQQNMDAQVSIFIEDKGDIYDLNDGVKVMSAWLQSNPVQSITESHYSSSPDGRSAYSIGTLKTAHDKFRIFLKVNKVGNKQLITEIKIHK